MKKTGLILVLAILFAVALAARAAAVDAPAAEVEPLPIEAATPTLSSTEQAVSGDDILPDDLRTLEDFQAPYGAEAPEPVKFSVWRVLGSLAIVVMLIIGVVYVMRLVLAKGMRYDLRGRHIKVMDVVQLGMNRTLYLVSVGDRVVLIGSAEKGLTYLADLSSEEGLEETPGTGGGGVEFSQSLQDAVAGNAGGPAPAAENSDSGDGAGSYMEQLKQKLNRLEDESGTD